MYNVHTLSSCIKYHRRFWKHDAFDYLVDHREFVESRQPSSTHTPSKQCPVFGRGHFCPGQSFLSLVDKVPSSPYCPDGQGEILLDRLLSYVNNWLCPVLAPWYSSSLPAVIVLHLRSRGSHAVWMGPEDRKREGQDDKRRGGQEEGGEGERGRGEEEEKVERRPGGEEKWRSGE